MQVIETLFALQKLELTQDAAHQTAIADLQRQVPPPIFAHYDRFRKRGKKGVAQARNGTCSECHMTIAVGVMATLMQASDIQLCGSCGRYLFLSPEMRAAIPVAAEPKVAVKKERKKKAKADSAE